MESLRQLRTNLQAGMLSLEEYNAERIRIINVLTKTEPTLPTSAGDQSEEDQFAKPFNSSSQVVLQVIEIPDSKVLPQGWYLGEDGQHHYKMQQRADGTAYLDPRVFAAKLHKV